MASKHGAHQTSEAYVVSLCEDFCKSPVAPAGYMILQKLSASIRQCQSVHGCGTPALNLNSRISTVIGNEAGTGGGVVSGVNLGICKPIENYARRVRAEGKCLICHGTIMEMNMAAPESQGNVLGKTVYVTYNDGTVFGTNRKLLKTIMVGEPPIPLEVYEVDGDGAAYVYNPETGKREIQLGRNRERFSEANETQHAIDDARDGKLNGVLHDEHMKELSKLEAEIRSDDASIKEADRQQKERKNWKMGFWKRLAEETIGAVYYRLQRREYANRKAAMEAAQAKIARGDLEGARKDLEDYPVYQEKVPHGPTKPLDPPPPGGKPLGL